MPETSAARRAGMGLLRNPSPLAEFCVVFRRCVGVLTPGGVVWGGVSSFCERVSALNNSYVLLYSSTMGLRGRVCDNFV